MEPHFWHAWHAERHQRVQVVAYYQLNCVCLVPASVLVPHGGGNDYRGQAKQALLVLRFHLPKGPVLHLVDRGANDHEVEAVQFHTGGGEEGHLTGVRRVAIQVGYLLQAANVHFSGQYG